MMTAMTNCSEESRVRTLLLLYHDMMQAYISEFCIQNPTLLECQLHRPLIKVITMITNSRQAIKREYRNVYSNFDL